MASDTDESAKTSSTDGGAAEAGAQSSARSPSGSAGAAHAAAGSRRPVTIDLKAETVAARNARSEAQAASDKEKSSSSSTSGGTSFSQGFSSSTSKTSASTASSASTSGDEERRGTSGTMAGSPSGGVHADGEKTGSSSSFGSGGDGTGGKSGGGNGSGKPPFGPSAFSQSEPTPHFVSLPVALLTSVAVTVVLLGAAYGLQMAGVLPAPGSSSSADARLTALEHQVTTLRGRMQTTSSQSGELINNLEQRLTRLEDGKSHGSSAGSGNASGASESAGASSGEADSTDIISLRQELEALKQEIAGLGTAEAATSVPAKTRAPAGASKEAVSAQGKRIGAAEEKLAALDKELQALSGDIKMVQSTATAAQQGLSSSDASLQDLKESQQTVADGLQKLSGDVSSLKGDTETALASLKSSVGDLDSRLAALEAKVNDASSREVASRAVAISALRTAVDAGRPYRTELAAVEGVLPKGTDLTALQTYADKGVEPRIKLIAEFPEKARAIYAAFTRPKDDGDLVDSLLSGAKSLIAVRGPGDAKGTGPEAVLRRMENSVASGDLETALKDYADLPQEGKAAAADWVEEAKARVAVDHLTKQISDELLALLARKDG